MILQQSFLSVVFFHNLIFLQDHFQLNNFHQDYKSKNNLFFLGTPTRPTIGILSITKAAFKVYSFLPAIYSFVPSIGSINQNVLNLFFLFKSTVSSETIGNIGVNSKIFFVIISLTLKSPLLTGDSSSFNIYFETIIIINLLTLYQPF